MNYKGDNIAVMFARLDALLCTTLIASMLGCASPPERPLHNRPQQKLEAHVDLLRPYSEEVQSEAPSEAPYSVRYVYRGRQLVYVAAKHEGLRASATFKLVEASFEHLKPQVVLIEGIPASLGPSPKPIVSLVSQVPLNGPWPNGEAFYAARLAVDGSVPFQGAEPDDREILLGFEEHGYNWQDVIGYQLTRQIPQWRRESRNEPLKVLVNSFVYEFLKSVKREGDFDLEDLAIWYQEKTGRTFSNDAIDEIETAPIVSDAVSSLQKMALLDILIRDSSIIMQIARNVERYERVLIVYGSSHHVMQLKALEAMFGKGELLVLSH